MAELSMLLFRELAHAFDVPDADPPPKLDWASGTAEDDWRRYVTKTAEKIRRKGAVLQHGLDT
jgi:hypothetical protein